MLKHLATLLLILALASVAVWVVENPGEMELSWLGYQIKTSVAFVMVLLVVAITLFWLSLRIILSLFSLPGQYSKNRQISQQQQGLKALTDAFIAMGERNPEEAKKQIKRAERSLADPTLPRLLQLQVMKQNGETDRMKEQLKLLQESPQTQPLALRGLIEEAKRFGRMREASAHVEKLLKIKPRDGYALRTAIDVFSYERRWHEAEKLAKKALRYKTITKNEVYELLGCLYTEQAQIMLEERNRQSAMNLYKTALRYAPGLTEAAQELATLYIHSGKKRQARLVINKAWAHSPHPDLVELFDELYTDLKDDKKLQKVRELAKHNPDSMETHFYVARTAMKAGEHAIARNHLKSALSTQETVTACKLMAELETSENHDENASKNWLERATTATPDPVWHCNHCGAHPKSWSAHCGQCHHFGSIEWGYTQPAAVQILSANSTS